MVPVTSLWLPIVLSGVLVFVASSLIHMVLGYHKGDYRALPAQMTFRKRCAGSNSRSVISCCRAPRA